MKYPKLVLGNRTAAECQVRTNLSFMIVAVGSYLGALKEPFMFSSLFWEAENFNLVIFKVQRVFPWEWLERIHAVVHDEESKRLKMSNSS